MRVPIRTLSPQDAEILARTTVTGVVTNGYVERHGLRWRSDALRTWEVSQRSLGNKPKATIRIDELDLSVVYVEVDDGSRKIIKATSTQPMYTNCLSLYEHKKLKQERKKLQLKDRLFQMKDEQAFKLRIQYYAELGHASDSTAYKRLVGLRDQLAALRANTPGSEDATEEPAKPPQSAKRKATSKKSQGDSTPESASDPTPTRDTPQPQATSPAPADAKPSTSSPCFFTRRTPK